MKIRTLLAQAKRCKTEDEAQALLLALQTVFARSRATKGLFQANAEAYLEEGRPSVRFELNQVLSGFYITCICPEIRDGALTVTIALQYMADGYGMASQNWDIADGTEEEVLVAEEDQTITELVKLAVDAALVVHQELIERLGVPPKAALTAAKKTWKN